MSEQAATQQTDALEMSDEEFLALGDDLPEVELEDSGDLVAWDEAPEGGVEQITVVDDGVEEEPEPQEEQSELAAADDEVADQPGEDEPDEPQEEDPGVTADAGDLPADADEVDPAEGGEEEVVEADAEGEEAEDTDEADEAAAVTAAWAKVTAPFTANGKEMQVTDPDDIIRLMQMGANYNKKMAGLKPSLRVLKMLEKADLMDENKLSFLIDLNEKNPDAIRQLLKDSGTDPMELDLSEDKQYQAPNRSVDDREIELDTVLDSLRESPSYDQTLQIVGTVWDDESKQIVAENPQLLRVINDHVSSGIYDRISTEVEKERMFGRLGAVSDIEAYRQVGDALDKAGAFNDLTGNQPAPQKAAAPAPEPKPEAKAQDQERKEKRRAASPSRQAPSSQRGNNDFNPLAMSDDEFMKSVDPNLL